MRHHQIDQLILDGGVHIRLLARLANHEVMNVIFRDNLESVSLVQGAHRIPFQILKLDGALGIVTPRQKRGENTRAEASPAEIAEQGPSG